jgi:beta-mannanase
MSVFRRLIAAGLAAGVVLTLSACSKVQQIHSAMSSAQSMASANMSQWTADKMTQAFAAINARIGADPADYLEVNINKYSLDVKAIDPHKRENVDQYSYQGGGGVQVKPVDVSHSDPGAVEANAFKGDIVKPAVVAQAMASAPNDSAVENGTMDLVFVKRVSFSNNEPQIMIYVKGPRASKTVHYDLTGKLLNVS